MTSGPPQTQRGRNVVSSLVLSLTRAGLLGAAAAGLLGSGTALAQPTVEQLQQEIQQRDKQIQQLLKRMDALEKEVRSRPATTTAAAPRQPANPNGPRRRRALIRLLCSR